MDSRGPRGEINGAAPDPPVDPRELHWLTEDHERERAVLRALLDYSPVGVALFDVDHRVVLANPALARFARRDVQDLLHRRPGEMIPWMARVVEPMLDRVMQTGEAVLDELLSRPARRPGGERHWNVSYFPVRDRTERLIGTAAAAVEVTERVLAERRLRRINAAMQAALVPAHLPEVPGLELARRHRPAEQDVELGGDFHAVLPLHRRRWLMAVGDVCGRGLEATSITSLARHTLRDATALSSNPQVVLESLHTALRDAGADHFVTIAATVWRPLRVGFEVQLSLAGHPPALLATPGEATTLFGTPGTLLGTPLDPELSTDVRRLVPGSTLVLYTDGLTDSTRPRVQEAELLEVLEATRDRSTGEVADALMSAGRGRRRVDRDDSELLVVRVAPTARR